MTNKEIAAKLKISPATLSMIINNRPGISDATRNRVLQQIDELGLSDMIKYPTPSPTALNNLCFVVMKRHGEILNQHPFFLLLMESIEKQARLLGFNVLMTTIDYRSSMPSQIDRLNKMDIQGIIFFATEMIDADIVYLEKLRYPFVLLDNDFTKFNVNTVAINNPMGTFQAIEHLVELGHRKIGYLQCRTRISSFIEREEGYKEALESFGLALDPQYIYSIRYTEEGSYQDFKQLLKQNIQLPTALVADDDTIVSGVMKALEENGIRVPEDISLVGFNDRPSCKISSPPLTSINVPRHSFGAEAINLLVKLVRRDEQAEGTGRFTRSLKLRVGTQLIKRQSTQQVC